MTNRKIMIDSGCSPTPEMIAAHDLEFIGIKIIIDKKVYVDGIDIHHEDFYQKVRKAKDFRTEPPVIGEVIKKFKEIKARGYKELVCIHFSGKTTKLVETCRNASGMVPGLKVWVIDTGNVSAGARLIALKVIDLLKEGLAPEKVESLLPEIRKATFMQVSVSTLKYLVKNGRIGKAQGLLGTLLNMKPLLGIDDGVVAPLAKIRGMDKVVETMVENAVNFLDTRPYGIRIYCCYGMEGNREAAEKVVGSVTERLSAMGLKPPKAEWGRVWPTIACHAGPEGFAIAVYGEEKQIR